MRDVILRMSKAHPRYVECADPLIARAHVSFPYERRVFRIEYPESARPQFTFAAGVASVVDCSEDGFRYLSPTGTYPPVGTIIEGSIRFRGTPGESKVRGAVVRCQGGEVAMHLEAPGVSTAVLFAEQRFLRARYPARDRSTGPNGRQKL